MYTWTSLNPIGAADALVFRLMRETRSLIIIGGTGLHLLDQLFSLDYEAGLISWQVEVTRIGSIGGP